MGWHVFTGNSSGISEVFVHPYRITIKKEKISFNWTKEDEKGFRVLKENITKQPILVLPDFKKTFHVKCDASGVAIDIVLSQDNKHVSY
jgi:hypothetical protein